MRNACRPLPADVDALPHGELIRQSSVTAEARLQNFDVVHIFGLYDLLGPAVAAASANEAWPYVLEPSGCSCQLCEISG